MPYTVVRSIPHPDVGTVSEERNTIVEAVEYARELMRLGMKGVQIRDPRGVAYGPDDFDRLANKPTQE